MNRVKASESRPIYVALAPDLLALARFSMLILGGCYSPDFWGLPCQSDAGCGPLVCIDGLCGQPSTYESSASSTRASTTTDVDPTSGISVTDTARPTTTGTSTTSSDDPSTSADGSCCDGLDATRCTQGECQCSDMNNPANCGCTGKNCAEDNPSYICTDGLCHCPVAKLSDSNDCACNGKCPESKICSSGACVCAPVMSFDSNNCACNGPCPMFDGELLACTNGICTCAVDKALCTPLENLHPDVEKLDFACWPVDLFPCGDCKKVCLNGPCNSILEDGLIVDFFCPE